MIGVFHATTIFPIVLVAQTTNPMDSVWQVAAQSGFNAILVLILLFALYKERERDLAERETERDAQERRHQENLAAQRAVESAFRTNTNSILVGMAAIKHLDSAFAAMVERVKSDNDGGK